MTSPRRVVAAALSLVATGLVLANTPAAPAAAFTPSITAVHPTVGPAGRPAVLTVTGTGLGGVQTAWCGTTRAVVLSSTPGLLKLRCATPAAGAVVHVWVRTAAGTSTATVADLYHALVIQPAAAGWAPFTIGRFGVDAERRIVTTAGGATVYLFRYRTPNLICQLHMGSVEPPGGAALAPASLGPALTAPEAATAVAAFDAGFKAADLPGGVVIHRRTVLSLQPGKGALAVDEDGACQVGVWGADLPGSDTHVDSVRENLAPMVQGGVIAPGISNWQAWGATLGGVAKVARMALGTDTRGFLVFAATPSGLPVDLAQALLGVGVQDAMSLDIGHYYSVMAVSPVHAGQPLVAGFPNQQVSPWVYRTGWSRDYVALLAR